MIEIGKTLVSLDLFETRFACDLETCRGVCCVDGVSGAPLEAEEQELLEQNYPLAKPYMTEAGIREIESQGWYVWDDDGDCVTPLVDGHECAYCSRGPRGEALCAFELAARANGGGFPKPLSCHLYPVRLAKYAGYTAVNYEAIDNCRCGVRLGEREGTPLLRFLKEPLTRAFGAEWYAEAELVADIMKKEKENGTMPQRG